MCLMKKKTYFIFLKSSFEFKDGRVSLTFYERFDRSSLITILAIYMKLFFFSIIYLRTKSV